MTGGERGLLVLALGLRWPPEDYLRRKLEGLAARGLRVAVAAEAGRHDAGEHLRGVGLIRLPRRDERTPISLLGIVRDGLFLGARSPGRLRRLVRAARRSGGDKTPWREAIQLLRNYLPVILAEADVIHVEWESAALGFLPLFEACGCPVLVSSHGGIHVRPKAGDARLAAAYPVVFARAAAVHCVSEAVREEAARFGLDRAKARVIRTAVDTEYFTPAAQAAREPASLRVVGVGELNWIKGYDDALEAIALLVREGVPISYEIVGGEPAADSGRASDRGRLLYLVHELGLQGRVRLLGEVSQKVVREKLRAADVLLQASLSEGLPNTVLEAMACAVPVVVTDCGGLREAVEHGVEGLVCPRRSPQALADALGALRERRLARRLGEAGRARVCSEFTLAQQLESFTRLYEELAEAA